jgi:hypothetical protein
LLLASKTASLLPCSSSCSIFPPEPSRLFYKPKNLEEILASIGGAKKDGLERKKKKKAHSLKP